MARRRAKRKIVLPAIGKFLGQSITGIVKFLGEIITQNTKVVLILLALFWFWENKVDKSYLKSFLSKSSNVLQEDQVARADMDCRDNSLIIQKEGKEPRREVGVKKATFIQNKDGSYEADFTDKGFSLEPGFVLTAGDGLRLGVDLEYAYWKRWGLLTGVTVPVRGRSLNSVRGHLGVGYDLPSRWLSNSSIYGGVDTNKTPVIGVRAKFGGGL